MDDLEARRILEAVLLISDRPLLLGQVREVLGEGWGEAKIRNLFSELKAEYAEGKHGIQIVEVASGYQFVTHPDLYPHVAKLNKRVRAIRFSKPSLESLAIIAYRQPITRAEIEQIRGVDCSGVLETLIRPGFIKVVGRKEVAGRPLLYATTVEFQEHFGLKGLDDLPSLEKLQGEQEMIKEVVGVMAAEQEQAAEAQVEEARAQRIAEEEAAEAAQEQKAEDDLQAETETESETEVETKTESEVEAQAKPSEGQAESRSDEQVEETEQIAASGESTDTDEEKQG